MKVTEVRITKIDSKTALKGFAAVTFDKELVVKGIKIVEGRKGLFISFPSEKGSDKEYYDTVFPLNKELRADIEDAVLEAYDKEEEEPEEEPKRKRR